MTNICAAIDNLNLVSFHYDGHSRVVEPHTYGVDKGGRLALIAYQVRGSSGSGEPLDWRIFHDNDMIGITVLQETFEGPRSGYKKGDKRFSTILCEL